MSNLQQHQPHATVELPETLDSSGAKLVYLYLNLADEATIDELQAALDMKKVTLYPLLQTLTTTDLIDRAGTTYSCSKQPTRGTV